MNMAFIIGFALQLIVIYCPGINDVFKLQALNVGQFFICIGLGLLIVVIMEIAKLVNRKK